MRFSLYIDFARARCFASKKVHSNDKIRENRQIPKIFFNFHDKNHYYLLHINQTWRTVIST